jgi:catechol 2,3-dioxygenase-like lactoylglutathione lyase family enzyme
MAGGSAGDDPRPHVWVGHVALGVTDVDRSADFWRDLGMREVERNPHVAVLELRGGTHLVLVPDPDPSTDPVPFDLMVDDLDATRASMAGAGLEPSAVEKGRIHNAFTIRDPDGRVVTFNSTHVVGPV